MLSPDAFDDHLRCVDKPWSSSKCTATFLPYNVVNDNDLFLENLRLSGVVSLDFNIIPSNELDDFLTESNNLSNTINESQPEEFPHVINSNSTMIFIVLIILSQIHLPHGVFYTQISINKYHDDLNTVLSLLKPDIHVIGISKHKIHRDDTNNITNINLEWYHPFVFDPTDTIHGGTGFYIKDSLVFKRRDDLKFNSSGFHESTFIEIILPNKKNVIVGCIYRHPNSKMPVNCFINNYIEPLLDKLATENKLCSLMGDSHSGNLTIQIADHLFQFVLLEGFLKIYYQRKLNYMNEILKTLSIENLMRLCVI